MARVYRGWWIMGSVFTLQVLSAGLFLQAYGAYAVVWRSEFAWSTTTVAIGYSIHHLASGLLGPVQGLLIQRYGARAVIQVGVVVFGIGFLALSRATTTTAVLGGLGLMAIGASFAGLLSLMTVVVNWFSRRRATALALMNTGSSIGGALVPLVAWSIAGMGWRATSGWSGVLYLSIGVVAAWFIRNSPSSDARRPRSESPQCETLSHELGCATVHASWQSSRPFTAREALATSGFWLLTLGHALSVAAVSAVLAHLIVYLNEVLSVPLQLAASYVLLMAGSSIAGQLMGGLLGDRFSKRWLAAIATLGHTCALLVLVHGDASSGAPLAAVIHGLAWGVRGPLMGALRAEFFGRESFASIMGFSTVVVMLGALAGPLVVGASADARSYAFGFNLLALMTVVGAACFIASRPPETRKF